MTYVKINKIYFPFQNYANVKVDYSNKNNCEYHEINSSKEKTNKKNKFDKFQKFEI